MLTLPEPCPICGKAVVLAAVTCWQEDGVILEAEIDCETEPPLNDDNADEWDAWFEEHYRMPYVDWMPYEVRAIAWLNANFTYDGKELKPRLTP